MLLAADETGLAGWTVYLDRNDDDVLDADEPRAVTIRDDPGTVADEIGISVFAWLSPRDYTVTEVPQPGWVQTRPGGLGSWAVMLAAGQTVDGISFGGQPRDA